MIFSIIQVVAIFLIPAVIIKFHDFKLTKLIGTIGMAYLLGIIEALVIFGLQKAGVEIAVNKDIGEIGSHLAISIAIPLLLFCANLQETKKLSKTVLLSFTLLTASVIIVCSLVYYLYAVNLENGYIYAAMASGLYTGGTPNLNAIGRIFGLDITSYANRYYSSS
jgi:uncharacterized membrane protein